MIFFFILSCFSDVDPESKRSAPQSKSVSIKIGQKATPVLNEVTTVDLRPHLQSVSEEKWEAIAAVGNLIRSPCPNSWDQEWSVATSLVSAQSCPQDNTVFQIMTQRVLDGNDPNQIVSDLALPGPHFSDRNIANVIEIWIDGKGIGLKKIIERVIDLSPVTIQFVFYGTTSVEQQRLQSFGPIHVHQELGHKLSGWIDKNGDFEQIIGMLQDNDITPSDSLITSDQQIIEKYGIRSSPTWFVNGYRLRGLQSSQQIKRVQKYP